MDYAALLYEPVYSVFGVEAYLTPKRDNPTSVLVWVIDKTAGLDVSDEFDVMSLRPAALVRASELLELGVQFRELDGGTIQFNGGTWRIDQHHMRPSPNGERSGEVAMFLMDESRYV